MQRIPLSPNLLLPPLQIMLPIIRHINPRDKPRRLLKQVMHLLQRDFRRLREERPEEDGVREIADDEEDVVAPADVRDGHGRDLADHGVEGEAGHGGDGDAFGAGGGVEDFRGDDPRCGKLAGGSE